MHEATKAEATKANGKIPHETSCKIQEEEMATQQEKLEELNKAILVLTTELTRKIGQYELEMAQSREVMHRIASALERPTNGNNTNNKNGGSDWIKYGISIAFVIIGWVFSGFVVIKNTESELRLSNAVRDERDKNLLNAFEEFKKNMSMRIDLLDERYRQQSIDIESIKKKGR